LFRPALPPVCRKSEIWFAILAGFRLPVAGEFLCQFGAAPRRVVQEFQVDFTIRMFQIQVEFI
jgi:hypothetical protein